MLTLVTPEGKNLIYKGSNSNCIIPLISAATACKFLRKGCDAYLCAIEVTETPGLKPRNIPVV